MEERPALEFRQTSHTALRQHLISHRRVGNVRPADSERHLNSSGNVLFCYLFRQIVSDDRAQVAGVPPVLAAPQHLPHVLVH